MARKQNPRVPCSQKYRYTKYLENQAFRRWKDNLARGSPATSDVYFRRVAAYCEENKTTPDKLIKMSEGQLYDMLLDSITGYEKQKKSPGYIESIIKSVKSWLVYNNINITRKITISNSRGTPPTLIDERIPTREELKSIFNSCDIQSRTAAVLIAHCGMRLEVLGNYLGSDGLKVRDIPEMTIKEGIVSFKEMPTLIRVRAELSKTKKSYFTFLSKEGCDYLAAYLQNRVFQGETLEPNSAIITPRIRRLKIDNKAVERNHIRTLNIGDQLRRAIRKAGFKWRPYVLRSYFISNCLLAESKGCMTHSYRLFFAGHAGDIQHRYSLDKGQLNPEQISDMRSKYLEASQYLETNEKVLQRNGEIKHAKDMLSMLGISEDEINKIDLDNKTDSERRDILRDYSLKLMTSLNQQVQQPEIQAATQIIIPVKDVEKYLPLGWRFVSNIHEGKAIIERPS